MVNHSVSIESLSSVYPFSGSQTKGFDWSRDTAASIYVLRASIPLEIYATDEWENFEKRPTAPLPSRPILICHSFKLTFRPFIYFPSYPMLLLVLLILLLLCYEKRGSRRESRFGGISIQCGDDSPILLRSISFRIHKAINGIIRRNIRKLE